MTENAPETSNVPQAPVETPAAVSTDAPAAASENTGQNTGQNAGRFSLNDDGQIFHQPDATNPLPGAAVGRLVKGDALLSPKTDYAPAQEWLDIHVRTVLEPLFALKAEAGEGVLSGAARDIGDALYDHLGVVHRGDLEEPISRLDPDARKLLRGKGVRLGPILAFLPALVKPAAVKMRATLWGLWNDKALPLVRPADGRVSEVVDTQAVDRNFYRMIGYPVFGPRAIRIDMLDRVVTDVYDTAQDGVFEARHKYAEWLGTNLDGLHAILESMGHRRLKEAAAGQASGETSDAPRPDERPVQPDTPQTPGEHPPEQPQQPAENPVPAPQPEQTPTPPAETPAPSEPTGIPLNEAVAGVVAAPKAAPVVVKFMLKRGKMSERPQNRRPDSKHADGRKPGRGFKPKKAFDPNQPILLTEEDKARIAARKEAYSKARDGARDGARDSGRDADRDSRPRKPKFDRNRERDDNREGRIYTFESKKSGDDDDGNPFAILKNLKK